MTTTTAPASSVEHRAPSGLQIMLNAHWRSSRRALLIWVIALIGIFASTAASMNSLYDTPEKIADYAAGTRSGSSTLAINGEPYGVDTIGGVIAYELGFMTAIALPLMGILLTARWTRREEESGRLEMIRAGAVARSAPLAAALVWIVLAFAVTAAGLTLSLVPIGIAWSEATLYAVATVSLGVWFAAVTALAAQLVERTRAVYSVSLAVLAVAFVLRGAGAVNDNVLTWLSPLGWAGETQAFNAPRWWPIAITLGSAGIIAAAAFAVLERRDLGSGILAARPGPVRARPSLLNDFGLAIRMHRNLIAAWSTVAVLVGGAFGSLADAVEDIAADNAALQEVMGGDQTDAFLSFMVLLLALVIVGYAVQSASRVSEEEREGRLEPALAGAIGRVRWLAGHLIAICLGTVVVAATGALALGVAVAAVQSDGSEVARMLGATFAYLPAALAIAALAIALYAVRPALQPLAWLVFAYAAVVALLGDSLQMPDWAMDISPLNWVGQLPLDDVKWWPLLLAALIACVLGAAASAAFHRRDIPTR